MDVSNENHLQLILDMFCTCKPCYAHLGLPCGTCSRAREKPLPGHFGQHGPRPLRDEEHLEGFGNLAPHDKIKVDKANELYKAAVQILLCCFRQGCPISIENPSRSWLWLLLLLYVEETNNQEFVQWYKQLERVTFAACAHGSRRNKQTTLLSTPGLFSSLAMQCPQTHTHDSWVPYKVHNSIVYPTALEAEYPALLCTRMAQCVLDWAAKLHVVPQQCPKLKDLLRLGLGQQSIRHPPLIPEFREFLHLDTPTNNPAYKLLVAPPTSGDNSEQPLQDRMDDEQQLEHAGNSDNSIAPENKRVRRTYKYGVRHLPLEFMNRAISVSHPVDGPSFLHEITIDAIRKVVSSDPTTLAKERLSAIFKVRKLAEELHTQETNLKAHLHPDVSRCIRSKRVLVFQRLLESFDYWDMDVVQLLTEGVPVVGMPAPAKGFREQLVPASITEPELLEAAVWRRKVLTGGSKQRDGKEEQAFIDATEEEVKSGFLQGPYTEDEIGVLLETEDWSLNPRFALFQGASNKVRVIDDAKQSAVNAAYSSTVKLQLQDVDYVAAMVLMVAKMAKEVGVLDDIAWEGKTFDLSKAYKQLAVLPEHHKHTIVGFPVKGKWRYYKSISLPFGCTGSVFGFVRVSQAIWFLLTKLLSTVCSHYFDDFPTIERAEGSRVLSLSISALLDILGWHHAKEGDKALSFSDTFDVLGVTFHLSQVPRGVLTISNKASRIEKLCLLLDEVRQAGHITASKASELQGLLNFAVGFYNGRSLKHLVSAFLPFSNIMSIGQGDQLGQLCHFTQELLKTMSPRTHSLQNAESHICVFTDGAWENGSATAGAVVIAGACKVAFTVSVPRFLIDHWLEVVGEQIISQIELWAALVVRWKLRHCLLHRKCIFWIDNEAARACAIKANSDSPSMKAITRLLAEIDAALPSMIWIERVCSFSNPSDLPSRNKLKEAMEEYGLSNGGHLEDEPVARALLKLHSSPYKDAQLNWGTNPEHLCTVFGCQFSKLQFPPRSPYLFSCCAFFPF